MNRTDLFARGVVLTLAVGALATVLHLRESAADVVGPARNRAPAATSSAARDGATAPKSGGAVGVAIRLVDELGSAMVDAPELARVEATLKYWRRMRSPYVGPGGPLGRMVQEVALVRSGGQQTERMQAGGGKSWVPDPKVWNMAEGSFDQREAILAPPPSTLRFHVTLPAGAVLESAPAMLRTLPVPVSFEVWIRTSPRERKLVASRVVEPKGERHWADWHVDLSAVGGKERRSGVGHAPDQAVGRGGAVPQAGRAGSPAPPGPTRRLLGLTGRAVARRERHAVQRAVHRRGRDARRRHQRDPRYRDGPTKENAEYPPLEAWLPRMPEVAPNLDALAKQGVIFTDAHSGAMWTRPGTVAMLTGTRSGELGLSPLGLVPPLSEVQRFYAGHPPFLPLLLRPRGVTSRAFVNNFYMIGYAGAGVDMGFEGVVDHRYDTRDTKMILDDSVAWIDANANRRFALFVNFDSPHSPYSPPKPDLAAVPKPPEGPKDHVVREYLGEIHKDDAAIGELVRHLDAKGLGKNTFIVVTADHGETLSEDHDSTTIQLDGNGGISGRFHHLSTIWDETTRVPIIMRYPPAFKPGTRVSIPVQNLDIVPTILDLANIDAGTPMDGRSLVPLVQGKSKQAVPVIVEGRGARGIVDGKWRLVVRDQVAQVQRVHGKRVSHKFELYDLSTDPGERHDVVAEHPDIVAKLHAELLSHLGRVKRAASAGAKLPTIRLRFSGAGSAHHVTGTLRTRALSGGAQATLRVVPVGLPPTALTLAAGVAQVDFTTVGDRSVGFDVKVEPPTTDLEWSLALDGKPWPADRVFGGGLGLAAPKLAGGVVGEQGRALVAADRTPIVDPATDLGLFVTRDLVAHEVEIDQGGAAAQETMNLMRAWGYVRDKNDK